MITPKDKKVKFIKKIRFFNGTKILFTGGGTGGSVTPLLVVAEEMAKKEKLDFQYLWLGTQNGPEREMVEKAGIKFITIPAGKWRRYFSLRNFFDLFKIIAGFFKSFFIILSFRPNLIMTAGAFVSVPVVWAGWILRVPIIVHQQDVRPGLANRLMAPLAKVVTVTFRESLASFGKKAVWTGNPARQSLEFPIANFQFPNTSLPVVLIVGGGTGAEAINKLVWGNLKKLTEFCQVMHITGKNKNKIEVKNDNYKSFEFLAHDKVMGIMAQADLVVSRAGLGFLTEISYLAKPAIIIPMPNSHQEDNARIFSDKKAALVLDQNELTPAIFSSKIKDLLNNKKLRNELGDNAGRVMKKGGNSEIAEIINQIV